MRIVFRADASLLISTGHLMRCLTLADELTWEGHECRFICREHEGHLGGVIADKGYHLTLLPACENSKYGSGKSSTDIYAQWLGVPWEKDARQTFDVLVQWRPDWLVVDHYGLDAKWERTLASSVGSIMVIDDLANRPHECTVLLDQNLGRKVSDYDGLLPVDCRRLIGPRFALLRPEFSEFRERSLNRRQRPELKRILISLGGVDRTNVSGQILGALAGLAFPSNIELDIIMGAYAPNLNEVRQQAARLPFKATVSVNVKDMAKRMYLADLSIGAAGATSWERCCLGLPVVLIVLGENQVTGANALEVSGAAITIKDVEKVGASMASIMKDLSNTDRLKHMVKAAAVISDGGGVFRVVDVMNKAGEMR